MRTALTIAGSDSGGGAGIQADLKTFAAHRVYGTSAITAVTAQNTRGVTAVHTLPADMVTAQIEAVAGDIGVHAVKTGMLANAAIVEAVAAAIDTLDLPNVVVDPVMIAKGGDRLLEEEAVAAIKSELLRRALVVTPNAPEAEVLAEMRIDSIEAARKAAVRIRALGPNAVIVKGGHLPGAEAIDLLYDGHEIVELRGPRIETRNTHGTGCTFAAAIAANLALGRSLRDAAARAKEYVAGAIRSGLAIGHGHGVPDHFWTSADVRLGSEPVHGRGYTGSMPDLVGVTAEALDAVRVAALAEAVGGTDGTNGAVVTFLGNVRAANAGRRVLFLDYEAFESLAVKTFRQIVEEAVERWPGVRLGVWHRTGRLRPGETSVAIVAASPHRADAFAACRYGIERVKQIAPIWKREFFEGGDVWIEGATADPHDASAREQAARRACV